MNVAVTAPVILAKKTLMKSALIFSTLSFPKYFLLFSYQFSNVGRSLNVSSESALFTQSVHFDLKSCSFPVTTKDEFRVTSF